MRNLQTKYTVKWNVFGAIILKWFGNNSYFWIWDILMILLLSYYKMFESTCLLSSKTKILHLLFALVVIKFWKRTILNCQLLEQGVRLSKIWNISILKIKTSEELFLTWYLRSIHFNITHVNAKSYILSNLKC